MVSCLEQGLFSYHPLIDTAIFREFPRNMDPEAALKFWNETFVRYRSDEKHIGEVFRILVRQPEVYYLPYYVFQHELRSHRFPLSISFFGTMLIFYNSIANQLFLKGLKARKMGRFDDSIKVSSLLSQFEQTINNLLVSTRHVLEGLALFNHFIFLGIILQEAKIPKPAKTALKLVVEIVDQNKKYDPQAHIYEIGFRHAMEIDRKLGRWGVEIASMYALNPVYNMINPYHIPKDHLPLERFASLSRLPIETEIKRDEPNEVLQFIQSELRWDGWKASRNLILSNISRELSGLPIPSDDFVRPAETSSHYIPEMVLIYDQTRFLSRMNASDLITFFQNFTFTILRKQEENMLKKGIMTMNDCPIKLLFSSCAECLNMTKGLAHDKVLRIFKEEFNIEIPNCKL